MSMQIEKMSMQMLSQSHYKRIAEIIKEYNLTNLSGSNLTKELNRILSSGKVDMTKDQEFLLNLFGYQWDKDEYISSGMRIFFYWVYLIIFCIGISGNLLVIWVFITNKTMHSVTNLFIANLAISDILLCLFAVPFTPLYLLTFKEWIFGSALCHLVPYVQGVSVYISALTLMSIAIDRFFVIIYPFKPRMKMHVCMLIILAIWISSAGLTLPYGYFVEIIESHMNGVYYCDEIWPSESARRTFGISTSLLQFVIPVTIISYCYIRVCGKLSKTRGIIPGSSKSARKEELERERSSRTNRMLISMVIVFGVSWFPLNCYNLLLDFHIQAARWNYSRAFFLLSHSIAMSSTCYNPLLYAWLNENFRKEFKSVLPCWRSSQLNNLLTINNNNSSRRENHSSFKIIGNLLGNTVTTQTGDSRFTSQQNNHHENCISLQKLGKNDRQNHEKISFEVVPIEVGIDIENDESLNYNGNGNENENKNINGKSNNKKENGNGIRKHECNTINNNHKQQTTVKYLSNSNCIVMHTSHLNSLENGQDDHEEDLDDDDAKQIIL